MADDENLERLLDEWEDMRAAGQTVVPEALCADAPDLVAEVRGRTAALVKMEWVCKSAEEAEPAPAMGWVLGGKPIPGYVLQIVIGQGGAGEVWKASGPGGVTVALKRVALEGRMGASELAAFQLLKGVRHPHLLTLFGAWELGECLVVAMELAEGSLADLACARPTGFTCEELLGFFADAASGLDFLHHCDPTGVIGGGVQHRDVKPSNLLVVGGRVKVGDFGLARVVGLNGTGHSGAMSVCYAAPEFFEGRTSSASDQYSLAISYVRMRTGVLPVPIVPAETMAAHLGGMLDLSRLPPAEQPAVRRALNRDPSERWPSCSEFIESLRMCSDGSRQSFDESSLGRSMTRRSLLCLGATAATFGGLAVLGSRFSRREEEPSGSIPPGFDGNPSSGEVVILRGHEGIATSLAMIPETENALSGGFDGVIRIWDLKARRKSGQLGRHPSVVRCIAVSPDGNQCAVGGGLNGTGLAVKIWDLRKHRVVAELMGHRHHVHSVLLLPQGRVVTASLDGTVRVWNANTGAELYRFEGLDREDISPAGWDNQVWQMAVAADGRKAVCGLRDGTARVFDIESGRQLIRLKGHQGTVNAVGITPDGMLAFTAAGGIFPAGNTSDDMIRIWDLKSGQELLGLDHIGAGLRSFAMLPNGLQAAFAGTGVGVLNLQSGWVGMLSAAPVVDQWCVCVDAKGKRLLSAGADGAIRMHRLQEPA